MHAEADPFKEQGVHPQVRQKHAEQPLHQFDLQKFLKPAVSGHNLAYSDPHQDSCKGKVKLLSGQGSRSWYHKSTICTNLKPGRTEDFIRGEAEKGRSPLDPQLAMPRKKFFEF